MSNSMFTIKNFKKAKKYLIETGIPEEKIDDLSGYEVVLTAAYIKQKEKADADRHTI